MESMIKKDKIIYFIIATCLTLSLILVGLIITKNIKLNTLKVENQKLDTKISKIDGSINIETDTSNKIISINKDIVLQDEKITSEFFKPAFSWESSEEYEKIRSNYIQKLGDNNNFTSSYMPEDIKVMFKGEEISRIDYRSLKIKLDDIKIVPLVAEGNRIKYVAFISFFPYKEKKNLVNEDVLESGEAIVNFTIAGEGENREVIEASASSGFKVAE